MLQVFTKDVSTLVLDGINPEKDIEAVNAHIRLCKCENMTVDITHLNIIDACMVSTICSTAHFMKYPGGKIDWITNSKDIETFISGMKLGNSHYIYNP